LPAFDLLRRVLLQASKSSLKFGLVKTPITNQAIFALSNYSELNLTNFAGFKE
jgi:hypothetical protein